MDPAEYPAQYPLPVDSAEYPASIEPERLPSIRQDPASIPPEQLASLVLLNVPPGAQLGLHFMLVPSCFECALRLGKGDAFVLLWVRVSFWKGLVLLTEPMFEFSTSARRQVEFDTQTGG